MKKRKTLLKHKYIKLSNKSKLQKKFRFNKKSSLVFILLLILIIISVIISLAIIYKRNKIEPDIIPQKIKRKKLPGEIMYKGDWIFPADLLNQTLSRVSDKFKDLKIYDTNQFNKYFYFDEYEEKQEVKQKLKNKLLEKISEIR